MRMHRVVSLLMLAGCGGGGCDTGKDCGVVGCGPALTLRSTTLPLTASEIQASSVTVCRNGECYSRSFASTVPQRDATHAPLILVSWSLEDTGYRIEVIYMTWSWNDPRDGDRYDVTVTGGDGNDILEAHKTVTYTVSYPNGASCGPPCRTYVDSF
jgi:hypothetical protein